MATRRGVLALVESGRLERGLRTARARHDEERRGACLPDHAGTSRAPRAAPGVHAAVRARADADHPACLPSQGAAGEVVQAHMGRGLQEDGAAGTPLPRPSTQRRPQFGARRRVTAVAMKLVGHKTESVYRRYAIVAESDLREAGAKLSALGDNQGGIWGTARKGRHPNP